MGFWNIGTALRDSNINPWDYSVSTSKATDAWNLNPGDNAGSAEHWKEKAHDWASYAEKLRKEIGGMVSASEFAKVNEALEKWINGVYVQHVKPIQTSAIPEATAYAESMRYAVTKHWITGWNDCRDYWLTTSKAGTAEIRELPEAAAHMYPSDLAKFGAGEHTATALSIAVGCPDESSVSLFTEKQLLEYAATPSAVKAKSTGEQL